MSPVTSVHPPSVGLVIPCFNEQDTLPVTIERLEAELTPLATEGLISDNWRIFLVDDGSTDSTWKLVSEATRAGRKVTGIRLTRNFGHQHALFAGLMEADADALISMDADLQDDVGVLRDMLKAYLDGFEIVYGVRRDRSSDSRFKRNTAALHYWLLDRMGIETVRDHADYRLMSRRAINLLEKYQETNLYLRGIIPQLGLRTTEVFYNREERFAGDSKYSFLKMLSLAIKGITSFSIAPLRFISVMGFLVFSLSMALGGWVLYSTLVTGGTIPGWASTVLPMYLLGGFQLLAIGIVGEYIGKSYMEVKRRPLYLIDEIVDGDSPRDRNPHQD